MKKGERGKSVWHIDMEFSNMKNKVNLQLHVCGRLFFFFPFVECFSFFCVSFLKKKKKTHLHLIL